MDVSRFDALAKHLSRPGPRRRLLGVLATVPLASGLLASLAPEDTEAHGRRKRRTTRHKHAANRRQRQRDRERHGKRKGKKDQPACIPEAASQTCAGKCGSVTNNCQQAVDCGSCSCPTGLKPTDDLQAAISAAADGATLTLCAGTWSLTTSVDIAKPLTLIGAGAEQTILDGLDERRVLQITANVPVTLQGLTITRGYDVFGGAGIYNQGDLTLIDVDVSDSHAVGSGFGGGILTYGPLTLRRSRLIGNTTSVRGGGIYNEGTVVLESGSAIQDCAAIGRGGGVYSFGSTVTLQSGSTVQGNTTGDKGGGVFNGGGTVTLESGSTVRDNTADDQGGAIYNDGRTTATVEDGALICNNSAPQCGGTPITGGGACPATADCPA